MERGNKITRAAVEALELFIRETLRIDEKKKVG
jgi:hypothetical protein